MWSIIAMLDYEHFEPACLGNPQTFCSQDPFVVLKVAKDTKELLFMWIMSTDGSGVTKESWN